MKRLSKTEAQNEKLIRMLEQASQGEQIEAIRGTDGNIQGFVSATGSVQISSDPPFAFTHAGVMPEDSDKE
jgi:hypothetical protein